MAVRIDTHRDNIPMQGLIRSCGFVYCGIVHIRRNGEERLAFTHAF
jgi:RimJ/RimL family protein N-acetyltransferase